MSYFSYDEKIDEVFLNGPKSIYMLQTIQIENK